MKKLKIDFSKLNGLIPVVIQDYQNHEVIMVGFMNEEAWKFTKKTGKVHYYSRKKKRIWLKGEESGHYQFVKEIYLDNDNDTLLIKVDQIGGACEEGFRSCFYKILKGNKTIEVGEKIFDPKKAYKNYSEDIILAIPSGSLYHMSLKLLKFSGYKLKAKDERSYKIAITNRKNIKVIAVRAEEIPKMVENEEADIGLTGTDLIEEYGVSITDLADLKYNKRGLGPVIWAIAVPEKKKAHYKRLSDFRGKRIATELVNITTKYFSEKGIRVQIQPSIGTTEAKAPFLADAVVDLIETGKSLRDNGLVPLFKIRSSTVHLIANNHSMAYAWKRDKIEEIKEKLFLGSRKMPKNSKRIIKLQERLL